jgi:hypothetical protein
VDGRLKGELIPRTDHVALHCQPSDFEVDPSGSLGGLKIDAFRVDEDGISVNWVQYISGTFEECIDRVTRLLASLRTVRRTHRCAIINVGEIHMVGENHEKSIQVVHDPLEGPRPNPAHSLICGEATEDSAVLYDLTLIADIRPF